MRRAVVTGIGVVSPLGVGRERFWDALTLDRTGVGPITAFDASAFPCRAAAEVPGADAITVEPELAPPGATRDRKLRFAVAAAREAWGDAGEPAHPSAHLAIGVGLDVLHLDDLAPIYRRAERDLDGGAALALAADPRRAPAFRAPADQTARAVARALGIARPPSVHASACAAGAEAIGCALRMIREGRAEVVVAGAADSMVNPLGVAGFALLEATSPGGRCRPFHRRRDGLVIGEGAAVLVIEERARALARGARIYAEVLGYAATMDAYRVTAPDPSGAAAGRAIAGALADAGLGAGALDYYNAHGTGTPLNDVAEVAALARALGDHAGEVPVSSTKGATGHWMAAAGAVEAVAALLPLVRGIAPATHGLDDPDPACPLDHVITPRAGEYRVVASSSFGFGGQNSCLVLGKAT